ncbi:MAG: YbjN domain-containing protein [Acidimicrobiia bacterium]
MPLSIDDAHALVAAHLEGSVAAEEYVQHVEYDPELRRWYVRFGCDGRDAATIYFDLRERTLRYELYFLPDPPERARGADPHLELYRYLLRRNHTMYGARFSLGPDGDVYLTGRVALEHLSEEELDRVIGVLYEATETWFQPIVAIAYRRPPPEPPGPRSGVPTG